MRLQHGSAPSTPSSERRLVTTNVSGYLSRSQLLEMGLRDVGDDVLVSAKASLYGAERISIGDNVRIDDFCLLSAGAGGIEIRSHVHIAAYTGFWGQAPILLEDFVGISSRVSVYSSTDDYRGIGLTGPLVPESLRAVKSEAVVLRRHALVGTGAVLLPGTIMEEGSALSALALALGRIAPYSLYAGIPARMAAPRERNLRELEERFLSDYAASPSKVKDRQR